MDQLLPLTLATDGHMVGSTNVTKSGKQMKAEGRVEAFEKKLGPFVVAAETTRMPMVFADAKISGHPIIFANDAFLSLTRYERAEVLGQRFNFLMAQATDADALAQIESEFAGDPDRASEILYRRKDGSEFWAGLFISPVRDESNDILQYFASFVDLTNHKDDEARSKMLINELNHRVKNTLSTVQSIVRQVLKTTSDPKVIRDSIESRLAALSRSHDLLAKENWKSAGLYDVVDFALEPFEVADDRADRIQIIGENIRFSPKAALALGIAFNELATNAVKYGALSNATGKLLVEWKMEQTPQGKRLILHWEEKEGPSVAPPSRMGFGSGLIERGLAHELAGTVKIDYRQAGLVCSMDIPAPQET